MSTPTGYSRTQIALHWLTAIAVLTAWFTHEAMIEIASAAWDAGEPPFPTVHTASGALAFILILVRLWLRRSHGAPEPEGTGAAQLAAIWGHRVLYIFVIAVPLLGAATWFGGFHDLSVFHRWMARGLMLLALGHAAMAIFHQVVKKDGTLTRMLKPR